MCGSEIIKINGVDFSIRRIGMGYPTIIVHGNRDRKENFVNLAKFLTNSIGGEYILIDLRGHGESQKVKTGYHIDTFVNDIIDIAKVLKIDSFNYIGHSLGSTIGIKLAAEYPQFLNKLILMSAAATFKIGFKRPQFSRDHFREQLKETNERAGHFFFSPDFPEVEKMIKENWLKIDYDVHIQMIQLEHPDLRESAKKIKAFTWILTGLEDRATTREDAELLSELIPKNSLQLVPGSHYMFLEYFDITADKIGRFLHAEN